MLSADEITRGKKGAVYRAEAFHEHDDCVRIAYEWLDAQNKLHHPSRTMPRPLKHLIENWGNRYVSEADVEVAAYLHPGVVGSYPYYNISAKLIEPSNVRLAGILEANTHNYSSKRTEGVYAYRERPRI